MKIPKMFQWKDIKLPLDGFHKISPSSISKFFDYPRLYFEENIQDKPQSFQGNTATTLGTICHCIYEAVTKNIEISRDWINGQLFQYNEVRPELELDLNDIMINYPLITGEVVNNYILKSNANLIKAEEQVLVKVDDGIYLGGTCDRIEDDCIVDFKTVATKPNENQIPFNYKIQLLAYAYAFREKGYDINRIRIVYGVKPTKTLPARCFVVTEQIGDAEEKLINDTIKLIAESVIICKNQPELTYLIFKSYDLK